MSGLTFDYFIWLDADTVFVRNPVDVLGPLGKSPLHVPLEINLSVLENDANWNGLSIFALRAAGPVPARGRDEPGLFVPEHVLDHSS
jgi:hypothetical protein